MCCHSKSTIIHSEESIVILLILMTTNFVPGNRDLPAGAMMSAKPPWRASLTQNCFSMFYQIIKQIEPNYGYVLPF